MTSNIIIKTAFAKLKNNPWGSYEDDNDKKNKEESGDTKNPNPNPNIDEILKKSQEFLKTIFDNSGKKGGFKKPNKPQNQSPKSLIGIVILAAIAMWLMSGIYKINPDENGILLYFGKFHSVSTPGLNYHIPSPIGKVIKQSVTTVNTEEFGFSTNARSRYSVLDRDFEAESLMLTGDENIVDIDFQVQWQISDIKDFVFNIAEPYITIRKSAESAMREIIARTPIADALSDGKKRIEQEAKTLLQAILDSYNSGIRITLVQMRRVDPPKQVIDSFRDVQTAKADKEKEINQAEAYSNDIIPRARGEAAKLINQAEAYKQQVISEAEGQASRFLEVYREYASAKFVTRKRIYLETMEKLYRNMDKIIIDSKAASSGVVPYLPLNEISNKK